MPVQPPNVEQLQGYASGLKLDLSTEQLRSLTEMMLPVIESFNAIERTPGPDLLPVKYPRAGGVRPPPDDNVLNAWAQRCDIAPADGGILAGKRVAIKDTVCVAGVPMRNGSATLEGYVPDVDATIVTRILDAGGRIVGKAVCEDLCFSGASHTSVTGPVLNPHDTTRSAGGSSSGSGALVASGAVDLAIGGDQGGSIRLPSGWCGIVGLKPTYGLVPYTGVFPMDMTVDHVGPMAATVRDAALLLEAIAGPDGLDPRQHPGTVPVRYSAALDDNIAGVRVGVLREGFGWEGLSEPEVDEAVKAATRMLEQAGAVVSDISVPLHRSAQDIWSVVATEGASALVYRDSATGTNWKGYYTTGLLESFGQGIRAHANDLSVTNKLTMLLGVYVREHYRGRHYALARNLTFPLTAAYDRALDEVDVIAMPTLPMRPTKIPPASVGYEESFTHALENNVNTVPFNLTGHPAVTVPCQPKGELPIGMMLVGRSFEDATVLRIAHAFETMVGGFARPNPSSARG